MYEFLAAVVAFSLLWAAHSLSRYVNDRRELGEEMNETMRTRYECVDDDDDGEEWKNR